MPYISKYPVYSTSSDEEGKWYSRRSAMAQWAWTVLSVLISVGGQAVPVGYSSFLLAALRAPTSPIKVDLHAASLLSSAIGPAFLVGQVASSILMEVVGRRHTYLLAQAPGLVGWLLIYFADSYAALLAGRMITGVGAGMVSSLAAIVIGEYTHPKHRGMYLSLKIVSFNIGSTVTHNVLGLFDWKTIALLAIIPYAVSAAMVCFWPESPAWLASKQKHELCREHFFRLRGRTDSAVWEVEELIAAQKQQFSTRSENFTMLGKMKCYFKKFAEKDFLKPLLILFFTLVLIESSGRHFFSAYADNIMSDIAEPGTDHRKYTLIVDVLTTVATCLSVPLIGTMRRRTLLLGAGVAALVVLVPTCVFLYLISSGRLSRDYQLIPISLLTVFFMLTNGGCSSVSMGLKGELFPVRHRGASVVSAAIIMFLLLTISFHFTVFSLMYLKVYGTFAMCGVIMTLTLLGLHLTLPETKDRTLQEIEDYFHTGRFGISRIAKEEDRLKMIGQEDA